MKMPKTLGATIDLLYSLREQRKEIEAEAKKVKEQEDAVEAHLMSNFDTTGLEGAKGKLANAFLKRTTVADITDWDAYYAYIGKKKAWDLLQRRPSITALRARWDDGEKVPGVEPKEIITLGLQKV